MIDTMLISKFNAIGVNGVISLGNISYFLIAYCIINLILARYRVLYENIKTRVCKRCGNDNA